jgi:hypothetical protein
MPLGSRDCAVSCPKCGFVITSEPSIKDQPVSWEQTRSSRAGANRSAEPEGAPRATATRPKRSTGRGEARLKIIAVLSKHHQYSDGGCLNFEPIGVNELARQAEVSASSVSAFFDKQFDGRAKYNAACRNSATLATALKLLNGEFAPFLLYGKSPPGEAELHDE